MRINDGEFWFQRRDVDFVQFGHRHDAKAFQRVMAKLLPLLRLTRMTTEIVRVVRSGDGVVGHVQRLDVDPLAARPGEEASGLGSAFGDHVTLKLELEYRSPAVAKYGVSWVVGEIHVQNGSAFEKKERGECAYVLEYQSR